MSDPGDSRASTSLRITGILPMPRHGTRKRPVWRSAAVRVRCCEIAPRLGALGARVKLVLSRDVATRQADGSFYDADVYLIYQTVEDHRAIVRDLLQAGKCVVVDVCDDVAKYPGVLRYTWQNAKRATAVTVPTDSLADRIGDRIAPSVHVVPDAVEGVGRPVRLPDDEGPLRLFWYGWQHKLAPLVDRLPDLAAFAGGTRPISLTVMTNLQPVFPVLQQVSEAAGDRLSVRIVQWSPDAFDAALEDTDVAIMPYDDRVGFSGRSPLRPVQAVWRGRPAITEDVEAHAALARFGLVHGSLIDGLAWILEHPGAAATGLSDAQHYIAETHRPGAVARVWLRTLSAIHESFRRTRRSRTGPRFR